MEAKTRGTGERALRAAPGAGALNASSDFGGPGIDRERVNALGHQWGDGIIYEPMAAQPGQTAERLGLDTNAEMPPFACAGMPCMEVAVVLNFKPQRRQRVAQGAGNVFAGHSHLVPLLKTDWRVCRRPLHPP